MGFTCRNAEPRELELLSWLFGDVASLLVSSKSIGDRGRSTLLPGLLSVSFLSISGLGRPGGEAPEAVAAAALSKC